MADCAAAHSWTPRARSTLPGSQVFREAPTEEELFADDAGPNTPLMRRGTNLPDGDEGFGSTLRALFSNDAPGERQSRHAFDL